MLRPLRPLDALALGLAVGLGLLAYGQWSASSRFASGAIAVEARVVEIRRAARLLMEPEADAFLQVEFETADGLPIAAELPVPVRALGLGDVRAGDTLTIAYDPERPTSIRHGETPGAGSTIVLALLAVGALFVPSILRRSSLAAMAGGGG